MKKLYTHVISFVWLALIIAIPIHLQAQSTWESNVPLGTCGGNCVTPLNGNGTLGQIYNNTQCGLNYVSVSQKLGQRFFPVGASQPSGFNMVIPPCVSATNGNILRAYLWCGTSGNGIPVTATITNPAGGTQNFPMTIVGQGGDKCWGYAGTYTYRADVTSIITAGGNYIISGLPTNPPTANNDADGATLMIIYADPAATYQGTLVIHDGTVMIAGGTTTQVVNGFNACANSTTARAFCAVGDIQMPVTSLTMNGTNAPFAWDWWNYVSVNTNVTAGQTSSNFTLNTGGDCFNLAMIGLYYQTMGCATCPNIVASPLVLTMASTPTTCSLCNGSATVTPSGVPGPYTYSWAPSGGSGPTATNLCAGTYTVTVTANGGCVTGTSTVTIANSASTIAVTGTPTNVSCNGGTNGSITTNVTGGVGPYTYLWNPSGGTAANPTGLGAGTYTVTVTDVPNGCTQTQSFTITEPLVLTNSIVSSTPPSCNGLNDGDATANATGGTGIINYSWAPSGGSNAAATNLGTGTYTVTATDGNGCTSTATVTLTAPVTVVATISSVNPALCNGSATGDATVNASGGSAPSGYLYAWSPSGGTDSTASNLGAGTYTVTVTDGNGCLATASATITEPTVLTVTTSTTDNQLCVGDATNMTATPTGGSIGYSYAWTGGLPATANQTVSPVTTTTYTVTATDANGCTATSSITINVSPLPVPSFTLSNICTGLQSTFNSTTTIPSGTITNTQWDYGDGSPTTTGASVNYTYPVSGTYTVTMTATSNMGCTASTTQSVSVYPPPVVNFSVSDPDGCVDHCVTFTDLSTVSGGGSIVNWNWTANGTTFANNIAPTHCFTNPGMYTIGLTVTTNNNCSANLTQNNYIQAYALPIAAFTLSDHQLPFYSPLVTITDGSVNTVNWLYNLGDGTTTSSQNVIHQYPDTGTYCIVLTATSPDGCTDTTQQCLYVYPEPSLFIPNSFTPNDDGINEFFTIEGVALRNFQMWIFNRWGEEIYFTTSMDKGWNGMDHQTPVPQGVYVYKIHVTDDLGNEHDYLGQVNLLR